MGHHEALAAAISRHLRGELEHAERVYLAALEADPDNVQALHYLGVMRHQQGRSYLALELVSRAIKLRPDYLDAINNLGNIYRQIGAGVEAVVAYQRMLELRPDHPEGEAYVEGLIVAARRPQSVVTVTNF